MVRGDDYWKMRVDGRGDCTGNEEGRHWTRCNGSLCQRLFTQGSSNDSRLEDGNMRGLSSRPEAISSSHTMTRAKWNK